MADPAPSSKSSRLARANELQSAMGPRKRRPGEGSLFQGCSRGAQPNGVPTTSRRQSATSARSTAIAAARTGAALEARRHGAGWQEWLGSGSGCKGAWLNGEQERSRSAHSNASGGLGHCLEPVRAQLPLTDCADGGTARSSAQSLVPPWPLSICGVIRTRRNNSQQRHCPHGRRPSTRRLARSLQLPGAARWASGARRQAFHDYPTQSAAHPGRTRRRRRRRRQCPPH